MPDKYYTVDQVAHMLDMHPKTIQRYIREGKLKASKVGKAWRISSHALGTFTEGRSAEQKASVRSAQDKVRISSVIDIDVADMDEAMHMVNMLMALLNTKPPEYGRTSFSAQYLESEYEVRLMLWGNIDFTQAILESVKMLSEATHRQREV